MSTATTRVVTNSGGVHSTYDLPDQAQAAAAAANERAADLGIATTYRSEPIPAPELDDDDA